MILVPGPLLGLQIVCFFLLGTKDAWFIDYQNYT